MIYLYFSLVWLWSEGINCTERFGWIRRKILGFQMVVEFCSYLRFPFVWFLYSYCFTTDGLLSKYLIVARCV